MKKLLPLLGLLCLLATPALAQRGFQIGLRAIPQYTSIMNSDYPDSLENAFTVGAAGGIGFGYGFTNHFTLGANVLYSYQGQRFNYYYPRPGTDINGNPLPEAEVEREIFFKYIQVPVFAKFGTDFERKYAFYGMIGPQFGYMLDATDRNDDKRYVPEYDPYVETANYPDDPYERYERLDIQGMVAAGLDVKLRFNLRMNVQLRAAMSVLDIQDKDVTYTERRDGVVSEINYWEDRQNISSEARNLNVGLTIGFTYVFIPRFHY